MEIMTQFLERNNIDVTYFARKEGREMFIDPQGNCHTMQFKGNDCHALVARIKYFPDIYDFYNYSDTS